MKPPKRPKTAAPDELGQMALARAVLDALSDHIYVKDLQGRYLLVNEAGLRERNLARLEDIVGKSAHDMLPRDVADRMSAEDRSVIESGRPLVNREATTRFVGAANDDAQRWHITTKIPMRDARGNIIGVLGINRDISDRKRAELALRESEETFRAIFDQAAVGITVVSPELRFLRVNEKYCAMLGYTPAELQSMKVPDLVTPEERQRAIDYRRQLLASTASGHELRERELVRKDGSKIWVGLATSLVRTEDGVPRYFLSVVQDISEEKRAAAALRKSEERFRHLAHHDLLTGLPNRALFQDRLQQALAHAARNRWMVGVMLLDLDRFKQVNDTLGHAVGDQLLNRVAARLSGSVRSGDTVARVGGDEFAVILSNLAAPQDAGIVAQKIIARFAEPFRVDDSEVATGISIGIALYPGNSTDWHALFRNADAAMYAAKGAGRSCYRFYRSGRRLPDQGSNLGSAD
ncbi:MAG TPA: diguanylate cyclase [Burkholderiales bacterium]|nr:diguanylate cyclase [Burkholderiales bacterium]